MSTKTDIDLPIVDLARFHAGPTERAAFLDHLRGILYDHGFFYLKGHGVAPDLIADALAASRSFFALPDAQKLDIEMANSPHFRGYTRPG